MRFCADINCYMFYKYVKNSCVCILIGLYENDDLLPKVDEIWTFKKRRYLWYHFLT